MCVAKSWIFFLSEKIFGEIGSWDLDNSEALFQTLASLREEANINFFLSDVFEVALKLAEKEKYIQEMYSTDTCYLSIFLSGYTKIWLSNIEQKVIGLKIQQYLFDLINTITLCLKKDVTVIRVQSHFSPNQGKKLTTYFL